LEEKEKKNTTIRIIFEVPSIKSYPCWIADCLANKSIGAKSFPEGQKENANQSLKRVLGPENPSIPRRLAVGK